MKHTLIKMSTKGWKKEFDSQLEAKEVLYQNICSHCLREILFEKLTGERLHFGVGGNYFTFEQNGLWEETPMPNINSVEIDELLSTTCGLEYFYEEIYD